MPFPHMRRAFERVTMPSCSSMRKAKFRSGYGRKLGAAEGMSLQALSAQAWSMLGSYWLLILDERYARLLVNWILQRVV